MKPPPLEILFDTQTEAIAHALETARGQVWVHRSDGPWLDPDTHEESPDCACIPLPVVAIA